MKNIFIAIIIFFVAGLTGFFIITKQLSPKPEAASLGTYQQAKTNLRQATMKIDGMWCASCAVGAEYALKDKEGVIDANIDYENEVGAVIYDSSKISEPELIKAVEPYTAVITEDRVYK